MRYYILNIPQPDGTVKHLGPLSSVRRMRDLPEGTECWKILGDDAEQVEVVNGRVQIRGSGIQKDRCATGQFRS